jgi:hypothetical protein
VSRPSRFPGRMLRLAAIAGALAASLSNPAAFTLTAIAALVAVSAVLLVVLVAVLGRSAAPRRPGGTQRRAR